MLLLLVGSSRFVRSFSSSFRFASFCVLFFDCVFLVLMCVVFVKIECVVCIVLKYFC